MIPPKRLRHFDFKFYLVAKNKKLPMQKKWNSENNYYYTDPILKQHVKDGGNYGICTGYGNLIVLDFDSIEYYFSVKDKLPKTFTVQTAKSRLYHKYYFLDGEMIRKVGIDINNKRVMDIQAHRSGIIAPLSCVNERFYHVIDDCPIATVTYEELDALFDLKKKKTRRRTKTYDDEKEQPEEIKKTIKKLNDGKVKRCQERHYKCRFHDMNGTSGNLWVTPNGSIYCFHCQRHWRNAEAYLK